VLLIPSEARDLLRVDDSFLVPHSIGPMSSQIYVYILASRSRVLYTGSTRNLLKRIYQHRNGLIPGFTKKYHVTRLVYYEETPSAIFAFDRERQIKRWSREKKLRLIESINAGWLDLARDWFPAEAQLSD
jgi:putative endonuclease